MSLLSSYQFCFRKLGCTSTKKIFWSFILYCARFALLCFTKLGCTSTIKILWSLILHCARFALLCFAKLGCTSTIKIKILWSFILYCARFALTLFYQVRLHLDNKNKNPLSFYFVLCSVCTNFVRNLENKTNLSW